MKLTKRSVELAHPKGRDYFLWDDSLPGFGFRIFASGKRSYLIQYRAAGRTRRVTIGLHGHLTLDEARKEAKGLLGEVAKGGNPADTRAIDRAAITMAELCRRYLLAAENGLILGKRRRPKKVSTLETDRGRIERHIKPLLGTRRVIDLTSADITKFLRDIATGKTKADIKTRKRGRAIVRGGRGTASRTVGLLGGILSYAVSEGIRADNPVRGITRFADRKRRFVLAPSQYRTLGQLLELAAQRGENPKAIAGVKLIALTGCRLTEVVKLRRSEADRAVGCFRFVDTKENENIRPIGGIAFDIIDGLNTPEESEYVLSADRGQTYYGGLPKAWLRIRALVDVADIADIDRPGNLTLHGLRHAFASVANELGYTEATRAALLGHAGTHSQTGDYTHHLDSVLVAAANRVSQCIHNMMTGEEISSAAKLVPQ